MRAAIYTRISKDPTGLGAGVRRQEQECRAKAKERGWDVVAVFSDNDVSAYSGTRRPGYEALLAAIEAGQVEGVVCWHTDRLYRRIADLERYIAVCEPHDVPTYSVQSGEGVLDLKTPSGRMVARQLASVAQYEMEQKSARQRAANAARAQAGKHFSTRRCFGYEEDGVTIREEEAQAIRAAYELVLAGGSLAEVARRWNAAGLYGPQGKIKLPPDVKAEWDQAVADWLDGIEKAREDARARGVVAPPDPPRPPRPFVPAPWTSDTVGATLRLHRLVGQKTRRVPDGTTPSGKTRYRPEVIKDETGQPVPTEWPAIVDLPTWNAVQELLGKNQRFPSASRQLLSGLAVCGECGAPMQSGGTRNGRRRYRCSGMTSHAYRESEPIDEYVERMVLARLAKLENLDKLLVPHDPGEVARIRAELATIAEQQQDMAKAFADGAVTLAQLTAANKRFAERTGALEARLPAPTNPALQKLVSSTDLAMAWLELDQDTKRSVIDTLCTVEVLSGGGSKEAAYLDWRARIVNPDTIRVTFR